MRYFFGRYFFGRRRTFSGLLYGCRGGGDPAEVFPVVAVVANEVRDFTEGLVRDGVLEGHDEGSGFGDG